MTDCIIVGGGLIGMLTARELQAAGASVQIVERGALGGESTWAGGGILSPLYPWRYGDSVNQLAKLSQQVYPSLADQLFAESGIDPQYRQTGMMVLDQDENDRALSWAKQWQMRLDVLTRREDVQAYEPQLSESFDRGLWMPDIAQMRNPRLIKSLRGSLEYRGIRYYEDMPVERLMIVDGRVRGVETANQRFSADHVVIAGGAWSAQIIQQYGRMPDIEPVKGQMILFKGAPGQLSTMVLSSGRYLIPRKDGRILVGSTLEHTQFEKKISSEALEDLRAAGISLMPELQNLEIEHHWAGLRPGSPQGVPYICEHPEVQGLYLNSGHYRNGVILGASSCQLLADIVLQRNSAIDRHPYRLEAHH